jgi:hypothetical protein
MSANMEIAQASIMAIIRPKNMAAQIPSVKNPTQSYLNDKISQLVYDLMLKNKP